jgi:micrococcal nuclease
LRTSRTAAGHRAIDVARPEMGACLSQFSGGRGDATANDNNNARPPPNALQNPVSYAAALASAAVQGTVGYVQAEHAGSNGHPQQQEFHPQHAGGGGRPGHQLPQKPAVRVIKNAYVEKMPDGDTVTVRMGGETARVRVFAIDAPESKQNFGPEAARIGRALILHKVVTLHVQTTDQYGRLVAEVVMEDGRDFGREMLKHGAAWHYKAYDRRDELAQLEAGARNAKAGLWAFPRPQPPWEYRKRQKAMA